MNEDVRGSIRGGRTAQEVGHGYLGKWEGGWTGKVWDDGWAAFRAQRKFIGLVSVLGSFSPRGAASVGVEPGMTVVWRGKHYEARERQKLRVLLRVTGITS